MLRDSTPRYVGPSVGRSVGRSVPFLLFRRFLAFWAYGSCPDALVTFSSTAPAHPHATRVAVYPALLFLFLDRIDSLFLILSLERMKKCESETQTKVEKGFFSFLESWETSAKLPIQQFKTAKWENTTRR